MRFALILSLVIAVVAVVFALQNPDPVSVRLGPFDLQGSTALILLLTFITGILVGVLAMLPGRIRSRRREKAQRRGALKEPPPDATLGAESVETADRT